MVSNKFFATLPKPVGTKKSHQTKSLGFCVVIKMFG